jgi:phosphoenolpyruvate carboxykinase (ATP)
VKLTTLNPQKGAHGPSSLLCRIPTKLAKVSFGKDPNFGVSVPVAVEGIEPNVLDPVKIWADKKAFDETAKKLVEMFRKNFVKFEANVDLAVKAAQPWEPEVAASASR